MKFMLNSALIGISPCRLPHEDGLHLTTKAEKDLRLRKRRDIWIKAFKDKVLLAGWRFFLLLVGFTLNTLSAQTTTGAGKDKHMQMRWERSLEKFLLLRPYRTRTSLLLTWWHWCIEAIYYRFSLWIVKKKWKKSAGTARHGSRDLSHERI